jgi:hypothetical protein
MYVWKYGICESLQCRAKPLRQELRKRLFWSPNKARCWARLACLLTVRLSDNRMGSRLIRKQDISQDGLIPHLVACLAVYTKSEGMRLYRWVSLRRISIPSSREGVVSLKHLKPLSHSCFSLPPNHQGSQIRTQRLQLWRETASSTMKAPLTCVALSLFSSFIS